jgi:hypothetical protein
MKPIAFFLSLIGIYSQKTIVPNCRSCRYFVPSFFKGNFEISSMGKCLKFTTNNTQEIDFDLANDCRSNSFKCGKGGRYYEEEPNKSAIFIMPE